MHCFVFPSEQAATVFNIIKQKTAFIYKTCKIHMAITLSVFIPFDCHHQGVTFKIYVAKILIKPFLT